MREGLTQPIDVMSAADSVITILGSLDVSSFPPEECIAVSVCQAKAVDAWMGAYLQTKEKRNQGVHDLRVVYGRRPRHS
jgi:hypothetical protein